MLLEQLETGVFKLPTVEEGINAGILWDLEQCVYLLAIRRVSMGFWIFMFICDIVIPVMMILFGKGFMAHPPKEINGIYGYRTTMSTKNRETWEFAHAYCGKLWWKIGWIMLPLSVIVQLPLIHRNENTIGVVDAILMTLQLVVMIGSIFPVERALKRNFDKYGNRIHN